MNLMEEATCSVCLEIFTNPQILVCSHNICKECTTKLCGSSSTSNSTSNSKDKASNNEQGRQVIICPICRCTTRYEELKSNIALRNMVELLKKDYLQQPPVLCDRCNIELAVIECRDCLKSELMKFCNTCCGFIHQGKVDAHRRGPLNSFKSKANQSRCAIHQKKNTLWCETDSKVICMHCTFEEHKGHSVITMGVAAKGVLSKLDSTLAEMAIDKKFIQYKMRSLEEIAQDENKAKVHAAYAVHAYFASIEDTIAVKKQSLLQQISNINFVYSSQWGTLESDLSKIRQFEFSAKGVKLLSDAEILQHPPTKLKLAPMPDLSHRTITLGSNTDIINQINNTDFVVKSFPKLYFGEGTQNLIVAKGITEVPGGHYQNVTVKDGGTLRVTKFPSIFLVCGTFSVEEGGTVRGGSHEKLYIAAPKITVRGTISCDGGNTEGTLHGGNIILACNHLDVSGTITAKAGIYDYYSHYQTTKNRRGNRPYSPSTGNYGTIRVRYFTGDLSGGAFDPAFTFDSSEVYDPTTATFSIWDT